jgi:hypothetical protein
MERENLDECGDCGCFIDECECNQCEGHPAGPRDSMGETTYCDGSCKN